MNMRLALVAAAATVATAKYPANYPLENEKLTPPTLIEEVPNLLWKPVESTGATPSGGYVYYYGTSIEGFYVRDGTPGRANGDSKFPGVQNGHFQYGFVNNFGVSAVTPDTWWNCTSKGWSDIKFESGMFSGLVAGKRVCEAGECCKPLLGMLRFSDDTIDKGHKWFDDRHSGNDCLDAPEHVYCTYVEGDSKGNCIEWVTKPSERQTILHCYDSWIKYLLNCNTYASGTYSPKFDYEPPAYDSRLSTRQTFVVDTVSRLQDKICYPYSYFDPTNFKGDAPFDKATLEATMAEADDVYDADTYPDHFGRAAPPPSPPPTPPSPPVTPTPTVDMCPAEVQKLVDATDCMDGDADRRRMKKVFGKRALLESHKADDDDDDEPEITDMIAACKPDGCYGAMQVAAGAVRPSCVADATVTAITQSEDMVMLFGICDIMNGIADNCVAAINAMEAMDLEHPTCEQIKTAGFDDACIDTMVALSAMGDDEEERKRSLLVDHVDHDATHDDFNPAVCKSDYVAPTEGDDDDDAAADDDDDAAADDDDDAAADDDDDDDDSPAAMTTVLAALAVAVAMVM